MRLEKVAALLVQFDLGVYLFCAFGRVFQGQMPGQGTNLSRSHVSLSVLPSIPLSTL